MEEIIQKKIETFFKQFKNIHFKKGEILIRAEDTPVGIFYLYSGCVKEYAISKKGDEIVVNVFKPTAFFPMSWAINDTFNEYYFEALEDTEAWRAPRNDVLTFLKNNPDVLFDLLSRLYSGVDGLLNRTTYLMSGNAYDRLILELLLYARRFAKGKTKVEIEISEKELAAQSGMTRETVSREMKILKEKKLIVSAGNKLIISNIEDIIHELNN